MPTCHTKRFGDVSYRSEDVIHLPAGVVGLPALRRWLLLEPAAFAPLRWLQSLDRPGFGFPVAAAALYGEAYARSHDWCALVDWDRAVTPEVLVVTTVQPDGTTITGNLLAPLVVDVRSGRGLQIVLDNGEYGVCHPIDYVKFGLAETSRSSDNDGAAGNGRGRRDADAEAAVETPEPAGV